MSPDFLMVTPDAVFLSTGVIGGIGILGGALALGIRHGIDWDHIAAITDITSSTASIDAKEQALVREPAVMLTDESHHTLMAASAVAVGAGSAAMAGHWHPPVSPPVHTAAEPRLVRFVRTQRRALTLGTLYALGHGTMVVVLGLLAILFSEVLPSWVDPVMERVVGVTLLFLGFYLVFSLYRFFRGEGEFRIRSRWMLVFSGVRKGIRRVRAAIFSGDLHHHHHGETDDQQYGNATSYGVGLIHGIGAETGTQVLVIGTAVGAASKEMAVATLFTFVFGLLLSNSLVIGLTAAGFVSAQRRQALYIGAGALAAAFSLVLGFIYLAQSGDIVPSLDPLFRWIGGPDA